MKLFFKQLFCRHKNKAIEFDTVEIEGIKFKTEMHHCVLCKKSVCYFERLEMETVCTCSCGNQSWSISESKLICKSCNKEYKFYDDVKACALIHLTNDNH